jgi:hypothetical protein
MHWPLDAAQTTTALISIIAAATVGWFAFLNFRRELRNQRLSAVSIRQKYFEDVRKWADQLADVLTEAIHLCDLDPRQVEGESFFNRRHRLRNALSSMIDRGRWFFPNIVADDHGADKELGYRGYRHEVLDGLVEAYRCVQRIDYANPQNNKTTRDALTSSKRHFVGQVQEILDPGGSAKEFARIFDDVMRTRSRQDGRR